MDKLEQEQRRAIQAKELQNNSFFQEIINELDKRLEAKLLSTDITKTDYIQDVVRAKQLLKGLEGVIQGIINDGTVANIQIEQMFKVDKPKTMNRGH